MLHSVSFYDVERVAIFTLLDLVAFPRTGSPGLEKAYELLKKLEPNLSDKAKWLYNDLDLCERQQGKNILLKDQELETLASATAFIDWVMPYKAPDHVVVVRRILKDHGICNT